MFGYTVVDPPSVVSTHITEVIKAYAHELIGRQETKQLIDHVKESYPILIEEVTPSPLSVGEIQRVLAKLLKEQVSIRNLPVIFEVLADYGKMTSDTDLLTEYVRQGLCRQITTQYAAGEPLLRVITLSGKVEKVLAEGVQQTEHGNYLSLDPYVSQNIVEHIVAQVDGAGFQDQTPIVLCSPAVRMYVRQLTERYIPQVAILSYNELEASIEVQSVGVVDLS